jgi:hypothetical protein
MTSYLDLEPCTYFDRHSDRTEHGRTWSNSLRAIGWLGSEADFPTGQLSPDVVDALRTLGTGAWQPVLYCGSHYCGLCIRAAGGSIRDIIAAGLDNDESRLGSKNLFIPGSGFVYAAPELILHYIADHHYLPPSEFCGAVIACPPMESPAYFAALRRNATGDFAGAVPRAPWWRFWNRDPLPHASDNMLDMATPPLSHDLHVNERGE